MPSYRVTFKPGRDGYTPPPLIIVASNADEARREARKRMAGGSTPNPQVATATNISGKQGKPRLGR